MSVFITYFVHGTTTDNEQEISSGWSDVGLSELGMQQSKTLAEQTKHLVFDMVFTSDLLRAVESARITWGTTYPVIHDPRLRECNYGDYNGKASSIVDPLQLQHITTPLPNGESYMDVQTRISDFLEDIRQTYDGKHIAIVAHKAPQLALDVILKGMTWEQAFANDWRLTKAWQPGWSYELQ